MLAREGFKSLLANANLHFAGRTECADGAPWENLHGVCATHYHLAKNDYSFDALQTNCFGINIKL